MTTLAQLQALLPGSTQVGDGETPLLRVHSDTRSVQAGDFFVALRGDRFDAHNYLDQARAAGAVAALAERGLVESGLSGLLVPDTLAALQQIATAWRARLKLALIAVTGSNGKTTVTQMIASILRAWVGDAALATVGNFNNHIGLPLTVLRLRQDAAVWHRVAALEMGMNHPGEIAQLSAIAQPTVALVNNAQREHQEFMHTVQAVAQENGAVITALAADGIAVFPADDAHAAVWRALAGPRRSISFALTSAADVTLETTSSPAWVSDAGGGHWQLRMNTPVGATSLPLHIPGRHNLHNALAATAAALAAGVPLGAVAQGLASFRPVAGRSRLLSLRWAGRAVSLVDDSYNANPDSVRAAIDVLAALPGPRWLVLGDMGEVGDRSPDCHAEVGAYARAVGIEKLWAVGQACRHAAQAFGPDALHFADAPAVIAAIARAPDVGAVLVKGSKFMHMPTVVVALQQHALEGLDHVA